MAHLHLWIPGAAARPQDYGPDYLENVLTDQEELHWTDQQGLTVGTHAEFWIRPEREIWFHFPFTVPTRGPQQPAPLPLREAYLLWAGEGPVELGMVRAHSGVADVAEARIPGGSAATGDHSSGVGPDNTMVFDPPLTVVWGLQIAVLFRVGSGGLPGRLRLSGCGIVLGDA